jgi:hypothetical protein
MQKRGDIERLGDLEPDSHGRLRTIVPPRAYGFTKPTPELVERLNGQFQIKRVEPPTR